MDGVGTSIVGRPRRLSADRRARPTYTLIWEEPAKTRYRMQAASATPPTWIQVIPMCDHNASMRSIVAPASAG